MKKLISLVLVLALALSLAACQGSAPVSSTPASASPAPAPASSASAPAEQKTYNLVWAGTSSSSGYYALNVAVCDIINSYVDGVTVTLMETGGTVDDYKLMKSGEASFGQTSNVNNYCLQNDVGLYKDFGYTGARDMCFFVPQMAYVVVTKASGIKSISDLAGKKFNAGLAGSASEMDSMNIFGVLGVTPDWFPASTADAVDAVKNRQIVGFQKSATTLSVDSTIANVQSSVDIDILSYTEDEIAKIQAVYPFYVFDTIDGALFGLDHTITTNNANLGFCIADDMPDDVAYRIVKAIDEHLDQVRAAYPGIDKDPIALTAAKGNSLIHPGVVKYMQERGLTVDPARIG